MVDIKRQSPVTFKSPPAKTELRDHWEVVLEFHRQGTGPWLVDLCHKTRWDLQDIRIGDLKPAGLAVPPVPGACRLEKRILVNRMNRTQAAVWNLAAGGQPEMPADSGYTDVSDATVFLGLFGRKLFAIAEKLSSLDFMDPGRQTPFLFQGPFAHVPCQIVILAREKEGAGAMLLTCSRGYARDMVHAILEAGSEFGLRPAGETAFMRYLEKIESATSSPSRQRPDVRDMKSRREGGCS